MENNLQQYKKTIYSQWGEDGLIEEIFSRIGATNKICIEFGAGNGTESSNVWHLIKDLGWKGFLMEGDSDRFLKWKKLMDENQNLRVLNVFVHYEGENSLENILKKNSIERNLDLLSIDIDGDDYYILKSLETFKPRVIIIEHNPTFAPEFEIVQPQGETDSFGSSARANVNLAHAQGYKLAAATHGNCIFVIAEEFGKLKMEEPKLEEIFDRSGLTYLVASYYGSTFLRNDTNDPSFSYIYEGISLKLWKNSLRSLSLMMGLSSKTKYHYAENVPKEFTPVKLLRHHNKNTVGLLGLFVWLFRHILKKFNKK